MPNLTIQEIPIGSQFVQSIGANDRDDLNDFPVLILADENVTDLTESDITLSSGSSLVSLEGSNSVHKAIVRPQTTSGMVTITVRQNAVTEGNPATSKNIRVSTSFPDADAEVPTELFAPRSSTGIAVSPTRILVGSGSTLYVYTHDGTEQTAEEARLDHNFGGSFSVSKLDFFNNTLIVNSRYHAGRFLFDGTRIQVYRRNSSGGGVATAHTPFGILSIIKPTTVPSRDFNLYLNPYGSPDSSDSIDISNDFNFGSGISYPNPYIAVQDDLIYTTEFLLRITENNEIELIKRLNIADARDIAIYRDTLYLREETGADRISTLDIRKYRPMALNTKTRIDVQFIEEGGRLALTPFAPDAEKFVFAVGSKRPSYLSINANNEIAVASNAVTETSPVLVRLTGINRIDSQDFEFYLVILQAAAPTWRNVSELTMRADSRYDLFQLVDAESIEFRSGRTRLADSSVSNGVFRVGTQGGTAHFTARKAGRSSHIEINIDVVQARDRSSFSDIFRHRVEIAGIDVTADVSVFPTVSATLDAVILNNYQPNEVVLTLKSNNTNNYKYNEGVANNFWQSNNLNPAGFKEHIKVCVESLVDGRYVSHLLFSGTIHKSDEMISDAGVQLTCVDESKSMQETLVEDFGTLEKWDTLRRQSDEATFEGMYVPEGSLLPMQISGSKAFNDQIQMILRRLALPSEGPAIPNTGHLTPSQFLTSGGYLETNPLLMFKTQHRSEDVRFLINQLALNKIVYNAEIDLPAVELDDPFILNRGSVAFSVERTRNTRILTDWVYDATNERILMLLSNPERHISDLLIQYQPQF